MRIATIGTPCDVPGEIVRFSSGVTLLNTGSIDRTSLSNPVTGTEAPTQTGDNMLSLHELFCAYRTRRLRFSSLSTIRQFEVSIGNFYEYLGTRPRLSHLTNDLVLSVMDWMVQRERSPATANKFRSNILALWRFAADEGHVNRRPDVDKVPEPDEIPIIWNEIQLRLIHDTLQVLPGSFCGSPARCWWLALHGVLWDTGERVGAVLQARCEHLDLKNRTILFKGKTRKWKKRDRLHILHQRTCDFLSKIHGTELIFNAKYHTVLMRYKAILESVGLPNGRKNLFQCLRKTTGNFYEREGGNATELFDHSSRKITTQYYLHPTILPMKGPALMKYRPDEPDRAA